MVLLKASIANNIETDTSVRDTLPSDDMVARFGGQPVEIRHMVHDIKSL
jgi:hypothetical protein